ncbi:MAG: GmrSD restriction endonuclease domain-containing protein [Sporichthyaceae bacterium]
MVLDSEGQPLDDRGPGFVEVVPVVPADPPVTATPPITASPPTGERPEVAASSEAVESTESSPTPVGTSAPSAEQTSPAPGTALEVLETLDVKGRAALTGYEREAYGQAWADVDRNGCDTRNDILRRDLREEIFRPGTRECVVLSGVLDPDPYTGTRIDFVRGETTSSAVQIDHVVALADSWVTGAARWEERKRIAFGNDPLNLLAVDGPANSQKGAGDAATWLPQASYRCSYVARQIAVKAKYDLAVKPAERDAMARVLSTCPDQRPPAYGAVVLPPAGLGSAAPRTAAPKPADPAPSPTGGADPRFDFCYQAKDAGYGPYVRGEDAEYPWYRDADSDGVVCE